MHRPPQVASELRTDHLTRRSGDEGGAAPVTLSRRSGVGRARTEHTASDRVDCESIQAEPSRAEPSRAEPNVRGCSSEGPGRYESARTSSRSATCEGTQPFLFFELTELPYSSSSWTQFVCPPEAAADRTRQGTAGRGRVRASTRTQLPCTRHRLHGVTHSAAASGCAVRHGTTDAIPHKARDFCRTSLDKAIGCPACTPAWSTLFP